MGYVDGFVLAVPKANKEAYLALARAVGEVFMDHGATRMVECWADDVPRGKVNDFYGAVLAREDEAVMFSWIEYPSREVRDRCNENMTKDPRLQQFGEKMPFDGMRMIFGGFVPILDTGATPAGE